MIVIDAENTWSMSVKQEVLNELAWSIVANIRRDYSAAEAARTPFLKSIHAQCIRDIDRLAVTSDPVELFQRTAQERASQYVLCHSGHLPKLSSPIQGNLPRARYRRRCGNRKILRRRHRAPA